MVRRRLPNPILGTQDKKTSVPEGRLSFFLLPSPTLTTPPRLSSRAQPRDLLFAFRFSLFAFRVSLFAFRFSPFAFRFSLFAFRFSLFAFRFSLFAFRFSLFAFRFSL